MPTGSGVPVHKVWGAAFVPDRHCIGSLSRIAAGSMRPKKRAQTTGSFVMSSATLERNVAAGGDIIIRSGNAAITGYQHLAKAYQDLATQNAERLGASLQALAAVKNPVEFVDLQKKLMADGIEAAVRDSNHIAELTSSIFAAAFQPVREHVEVQSKPLKK
jgi:phasin family protein